MKTFCVLPFYARVINGSGYDRPCCHWFTDDYDLEQVKQDMLTDQRSDICSHCWRLEDSGIQSDRQQKLATYDWFLERSAEDLFAAAKAGPVPMLSLNLMTSSVCNATCVSCGSGCSSSWAELERRMFPSIPIQRVSPVDVDSVFDSYNMAELKFLSFMGGEPLYERRNFEILERLAALGNTKLFVSFVTNGNVELTDKQKQTLSQFPNMNFCLSIDGTGAVYEYVRYPSRWSVLQDNLAYFRTIAQDVSAHYTISNITLFSHNETMAWFRDVGLPVTCNPISDPAWLAPHVLPDSAREQLKSYLSSEDYQAYIGSADLHNVKSLWAEFKQNIQLQDQAKGITIADRVPAIASLF